MIKKSVLVPIATGIEEIEAVTIIDVLRRGGLSVRVSSIDDRQINGANGIKIVADSDFLTELKSSYDAIVLPGGTEAAKRFAAHQELGEMLNKFSKAGLIIGAICASPALALASFGILKGRRATCYPSLKEHLSDFIDEKVVVDKNIITSQGPGTALPFTLKLLEILSDEKNAARVKADLLL